ncbi:MAG: glycosyltransferase [Planctomycetales bacterium]
MKTTLCVISPLRDASALLHRQVPELMDALTEGGDHFELVLVNQGSTDDTAEDAEELSRRYPQMRVIHRGERELSPREIRQAVSSDAETVVLLNVNQGMSQARPMFRKHRGPDNRRRELREWSARRRNASRPSRLPK